MDFIDSIASVPAELLRLPDRFHIFGTTVVLVDFLKL
jgi:hypothetical protein